LDCQFWANKLPHRWALITVNYYRKPDKNSGARRIADQPWNGSLDQTGRRSIVMPHQNCESTADVRIFRSSKPSVWRDTALGLAASLGVGFLTGTMLTIVVFAIVAITIGQ
jgi:hypothetical protein